MRHVDRNDLPSTFAPRAFDKAARKLTGQRDDAESVGPRIINEASMRPAYTQSQDLPSERQDVLSQSAKFRIE